MARYKCIDTNPRLLAVDLAKQLLPVYIVVCSILTAYFIGSVIYWSRHRNDKEVESGKIKSLTEN